MLVIGLTGGTGSGKGYVCQLFSKYNINFIDTDKVAREVCETGKPCLNDLVSVFGNEILNADKSLNRKKLASIVFTDKNKLQTLNSITHKYILDKTRAWLENEKQNGKPAAIVDAPLLFESNFDKECDIIISVIADKDIRRERLLKRDHISLEEIDRRFQNQGDDEFYTKNVQFVITNNGSAEHVEKQIQEIYDKLFNKE